MAPGGENAMTDGRFFGETAMPVVAGALCMALIWAAAEVGPVALTRWF